ncbi:MAG: hypothetical protein AB1847_13315 [bacterium]
MSELTHFENKTNFIIEIGQLLSNSVVIASTIGGAFLGDAFWHIGGGVIGGIIGCWTGIKFVKNPYHK